MQCSKCSGYAFLSRLFGLVDWRCFNCGRRTEVKISHQSTEIDRFFEFQQKNTKSLATPYPDHTSLSGHKKTYITVKRTCPYCGIEFAAKVRKYKTQIYCSYRCRTFYTRRLKKSLRI